MGLGILLAMLLEEHKEVTRLREMMREEVKVEDQLCTSSKIVVPPE